MAATIVKVRRLRPREPGVPDASPVKKGVSLKWELREGQELTQGHTAFFQVPLLPRTVALSFSHSDPQVRIAVRQGEAELAGRTLKMINQIISPPDCGRRGEL